MTLTADAKAQLGARLVEVSLIEGDFVLRSGKRVSKYFDKYRYEALPDLLLEISRGMAELVPKGTEVLAGIELGGIPLATVISQALGLPLVLVRKDRKTYGTEKICEGLGFEGKRVCLIEDVITTGGQVAKCAAHVREVGGQVAEVCCTILKTDGNPELLTAAGITAIPLFDSKELPDGP